MTRGTLAATVLWLTIATPAVALDPLSKLPPVPRFAGGAESETRLLVTHKLKRAGVGRPPRYPEFE